MAIYPDGIAASGVYDIFQGTTFSPNDIVKAIHDNYSPVNKTTLLNSLGYQVALVQNFVNSKFLGRQTVPVQNAYMTSGWAEGAFVSWSGVESATTKYRTSIYPSYFESRYISSTIPYNVSSYTISPNSLDFTKNTADGVLAGSFNSSGLYIANVSTNSNMNIMMASGSYGSIQSTWKANGTDVLWIGNDSTASYSGVTRLYGKTLELFGYNAINLRGANLNGNTTLNFCGTNLIISGGANSSNVRLYNNLFPLVNDERQIGDELYKWRNAYISKTISSYVGSAELNNGGSTASYTNASVLVTLGSLCGTTPNINVPTVYTSLSTAGTQIAAAGIYPNALILSRGAVSGYLRITDGGQLEFYKIGSSGTILTNYPPI